MSSSSRRSGRMQAEIELLAGRRFSLLERAERHFEAGGLPFVDVPDLRLDSFNASGSAWPIPDPVHPDLATVLQVAESARLADRAAPISEALWLAGQLVGAWSREDWPTGAALLWLKAQIDSGGFTALFRRLLDPNRFIYVPIGAVAVNGWWIQFSRRLLLITSESDDEPLLCELLAPLGDWGALVAAEPRLILARSTHQPADWAMVARVWRPPNLEDARPWRYLAESVHLYGLPVLAVDDRTTQIEAAAHLLLVAGWHGYVTHTDNLVPNALALAYPREVASVRRGTDAPTPEAAAALLWERLLRPGFDPARTAEDVRRYVRRQASTLVKAHRSAERRDPPWQQLGVSQRYYYKLLGRFAIKSLDGRFEVDARVERMIRAYLADRAAVTSRQRSAIELLQLRGFSKAGARKWIQRHGLDEIRTAFPRAPVQRPHAPIAAASDQLRVALPTEPPRG